MGDRNYYLNRYDSPQNNDLYSRRQPQQSSSSLFDMRLPQDGGGFSVNTRMPEYSSGSSYNQVQNSRILTTQYKDATSFDRQPPSYEESWNDALISRSGSSKRYASSWNNSSETKREEQYPQKTSFSNLFDIPGQTDSAQKPSEWSRDNYFNSPQSYQGNFQNRLNSYQDFSQQPLTTFTSDCGSSSDYRFSQSSVTSGRQSNDSKQDNQGFVRQNQPRGRHRPYARRGNQHNKGKRNDLKWQDGSRDKINSNLPKDNSNHGSFMAVTDNNVGSRTEVGSFKPNEEHDDNEDCGDGDERDYAPEKVNVYIPDPSLVKQYEYYPPDQRAIGEMFKDLVIYFFFKIPKNKKEENPFVVICESFRRSSGYSSLQVEDGYDPNVKDRKFCTLRYEGMMMVRGVGENNCIKEPRVRAGKTLIDNLAMSCYTLKAKSSYFDKNAFEQMQHQGNKPGVYCFVPTEEANNLESGRKYLQKVLSQEDSDVEYFFNFTNKHDLFSLKRWASQQGFEARVIKDGWLGICQYRSAQYWRDKILASGSMENEKFCLQPPQGIGNKLLKNFNIKEVVPKLKSLRILTGCTLEEVYGPPGIGPNISKALPPWERRGGNNRNKNNRKKEKKIMELVNLGVPLTQTKPFHHLSKHRKRALKKKLGQ